MSNCHPVILLWVCTKNGIACGMLAEYVAHRAQRMQELMDKTGRSKDEVKGMFLSAVNSEREMEGWCVPT